MDEWIESSRWWLETAEMHQYHVHDNIVYAVVGEDLMCGLHDIGGSSDCTAEGAVLVYEETFGSISCPDCRGTMRVYRVQTLPRIELVSSAC